MFVNIYKTKNNSLVNQKLQANFANEKLCVYRLYNKQGGIYDTSQHQGPLLGVSPQLNNFAGVV